MKDKGLFWLGEGPGKPLPVPHPTVPGAKLRPDGFKMFSSLKPYGLKDKMEE
jgi:hypothetical protein